MIPVRLAARILTIGRLAAELRMSKSGLFAHFGSKQELQLATIEAAAERFRTAVIEPAMTAPDGAPRLRAMGERYLDHLDLYSGGCFWGATSAEYDDRPGPVRDAIAGALDAWLAELERQARVAGVEQPERFAFELYAVIMRQLSLPPQRRRQGLRLRPRGPRAARSRAATVSAARSCCIHA